jgi:hypothetical protein
MDVDGERELDRAFDALQRLRDCGLAPAALSDEAPLLGGAAGAELRAAAASLAAAFLALPQQLLQAHGAARAPPGAAAPPLAAAAAAVAAAAAGASAAADGRLEAAMAALLAALDPEAAGLTQRLDLFGACAAAALFCSPATLITTHFPSFAAPQRRSWRACRLRACLPRAPQPRATV